MLETRPQESRVGLPQSRLKHGHGRVGFDSPGSKKLFFDKLSEFVFCIELSHFFNTDNSEFALQPLTCLWATEFCVKLSDFDMYALLGFWERCSV